MLVIPNGSTIRKQSRIKLRQLSYCILLLCGAGVSSAEAISLGDLQAQSFLGQALRASVPILGGEADPNFVKCVKARLIKLDGTFVMPLRVGISNNGSTTSLLLSSSARIEEPAFTVALETTCETPINREYQILLDPEDLVIEPPAVAPFAQGVSINSQPAIPPVRQPTKRRKQATGISLANADSTTDIPTQQNQQNQQKTGSVLRLDNADTGTGRIKKVSKALTSKFGRSDDDLKLRLTKRLKNDTGPVGMASQEGFSEIVRQQQNQSALMEVARSEIKLLQEKLQSMDIEIRRLKESQARGQAQTQASVQTQAPTQASALVTVQAPPLSLPTPAPSSAPVQTKAAIPARIDASNRTPAVNPVGSPLYLPGGVATLAGISLAAFLIAWILYRKHRKSSPQEYSNSNVLKESSLTANSVFGPIGGLNIDTSSSVFNSNFAPSASQLDTNEVDPIAEADVYIAYGRDTEAEEILKESLRTQPERNAVRLKLLEIYAHRKDTRAFEVQAGELYSFTNGKGDDWAQAASMWMSIDPNNPLFAGANSDFNELAESTPDEDASLDANTRPVVFANATAAAPVVVTGIDTLSADAKQAMLQVNEHGDLDFDLDLPTQLQTEELDYNLDDIQAETTASASDNLIEFDPVVPEPVPDTKIAAIESPDELSALDFEPNLKPAAEALVEPAEITAEPVPDFKSATELAPLIDFYQPKLATTEPAPEEPEIITALLPAEEDQIQDFDLLEPVDFSHPPEVIEETTSAKELAFAEPEAFDPEISADDFFAKLELDSIDLPTIEMPEVISDVATEVEPETTSEVTPEITPEIAPEITPEAAPDFFGSDFSLDTVEPKTEPAPIDIDLDTITKIEHEKIDGIVANGDKANDTYSSTQRVEMDTKLDLAIAYEEIGYKEGARELIHEVIRGGSPAQVEAAKEMLDKMA